MKSDELLLIDYSLLSRIIYETSGNEPDPNYVSTQIVARVRALSTQHPHAAICCDAPPYLRKEVDPTYKATRPEGIAPLLHQMALAAERLAAEGYPVWKVKGYEADDIIATAVRLAAAPDLNGTTVLIASSDKDLLQLVGPHVTMKKLTGDFEVMDEAAVVAKFSVRPDQMLDYLCLVGDVSDNVIGAKGIGGVTAGELLRRFGTLEATFKAVFDAIPRDKAEYIAVRYSTAGEPDRKAIKKSLEKTAPVTPGVFLSLVEFFPRWPTVRQLITLRTDVAIPFEEIAAERTVPAMETEEEAVNETQAPCRCSDAAWAPDCPQHGITGAPDRELTGAEATAAVSKAFTQVSSASAPIAGGTPAGQPSVPNGADSGRASKDPVTAVGGVSRLLQSDAGALVPSAGGSGHLYAPVDFSQQLQPRNMEEAARLAGHMFKAKLFNAYGSWEGVFSTILAGRELGIPAMAALRAFHIVEARPTMSADTMAALVLKSGKAKYFRCTERTNERCTYVTQRLPVEDYPEQKLTITIEDMRAAWRKDQKAWDASGWGKTPAAMLVAACKRTLARLEYPDVVGNLYDSEELQ